MHLYNQISENKLRLAKEKRFNSYGLSWQSENVLLMADCENKSVKAFQVTTGDIAGLWKENDAEWRLWDLCSFGDADIDYIAVTEQKGDCHRMCILRRSEQTVHTFFKYDMHSIEEKSWVCLMQSAFIAEIKNIYSVWPSKADL